MGAHRHSKLFHAPIHRCALAGSTWCGLFYPRIASRCAAWTHPRHSCLACILICTLCAVTHAVIGSEAAGMHSLPPELLLEIFTRLDAKALCALAQVSFSARSFANDDDVWCRSVGHSKAVERASFLHAAQLRAERLEAEARWRRAKWRRLRRRMIGVLQAICGVALVLLPLFAILRRGDKQADQPTQQLAGSAATHSTLERAKHSLSATRTRHSGDIGDLVWNAATCASGGGTRTRSA